MQSGMDNKQIHLCINQQINLHNASSDLETDLTIILTNIKCVTWNENRIPFKRYIHTPKSNVPASTRSIMLIINMGK